jgi:hypothetical protein
MPKKKKKIIKKSAKKTRKKKAEEGMTTDSHSLTESLKLEAGEAARGLGETEAEAKSPDGAEAASEALDELDDEEQEQPHLSRDEAREQAEAMVGLVQALAGEPELLDSERALLMLFATPYAASSGSLANMPPRAAGLGFAAIAVFFIVRNRKPRYRAQQAKPTAQQASEPGEELEPEPKKAGFTNRD